MGFILYPAGTTPEAMLRSLREVKWYPSGSRWARLADLMQPLAGTGGYDLDGLSGRELAYVWGPDLKGSSGRLYSRADLMSERAAGTLSPLVAKNIPAYPVNVPGWYLSPQDGEVRTLVTYVARAFAAAAVPWVFFFLLRWLMRGFFPPPGGPRESTVT